MTDTVFAKNLKNYIVSDRTLREDHLIVAFSNTLRRLDPDSEILKNFDDIIQMANGSADGLVQEPGFWNVEDVDDCLSELEDSLNDWAPEGYMFGAHDGDGACFGFWPSDWDGNP